MNSSEKNTASVGRSIMLEIDMVISAICGHYPEKELPESLIESIRQVPESLARELRQLLGGHERLLSFLEYAAILADAVVGDDYDQCSLAIRSLTSEEALKRFRERTAALELALPTAASDHEKLVLYIIQAQLKLYASLGKRPSDRREALIRDEAEFAVSILSGGERHQRFWMLLDRLYYQYWQPYRAARLDKMRLVESAVSDALKKQPLLTPGNLSWLPSHNPLLVQEGLLGAAQQMGLRVFFWSEPVGLPDTWFVTPELLGVSFGESGEIMRAYRHFAEDIARRAAALSDPSRLIILRLIREFGMYNTEIASFLNIARPTVSNHAKILREAGLITSRQEAGKTLHELREEELAILFEDLERFLRLIS